MADILYIHQCEKVQVKPASMYFCTEEVTVEVTSVSSESHLRFMDPISKVTYRNYTLTNYNRVCPNAFQLGNGSWLSNAKQLKLISTPKKFRAVTKNATVSSYDLAIEGFFRNNIFEDRQLSQFTKRSRKIIIGSGVFLGQSWKQSHNH